MLQKVISKSKSLGNLKSDSARLFYTWLIPWLDIEGRHSADPDIIRGSIFPKVHSMTVHKISKLLDELSSEGLIIIYKSNGETFLQLVDFKEHQKLNPDREAPSIIPSPDECSRVNQSNSGPTQEDSRVNQANSPLSKDKLSLSKAKDKVSSIISYLNEKTGKNFSDKSESTAKLISGRLAEGRTIDDFKKVIDTKVTAWKGDAKMDVYLRPVTLFRPSNFESYLNEKAPKKSTVGVNLKPKSDRDKEFEVWKASQEKTIGRPITAEESQKWWKS